MLSLDVAGNLVFLDHKRRISRHVPSTSVQVGREKDKLSRIEIGTYSSDWLPNSPRVPRKARFIPGVLLLPIASW